MAQMRRNRNIPKDFGGKTNLELKEEVFFRIGTQKPNYPKFTENFDWKEQRLSIGF